MSIGTKLNDAVNFVVDAFAEAKKSITKGTIGYVAAAGLPIVLASCGDPSTGKEPVKPGGGTEITYIPEVTGRNNGFNLSMADSSLVLFMKEYGDNESQNTVVTVKLSASKNSKGQPVTFDRPLLSPDNFKEVTSSGVIKLYDYNKPMTLSQEGKTVAQTIDQKTQIKKIMFTRNTGTYVDNVPAGLSGYALKEQVQSILNLPFKVEGDQATLPVQGVPQNFKVSIK